MGKKLEERTRRWRIVKQSGEWKGEWHTERQAGRHDRMEGIVGERG